MGSIFQFLLPLKFIKSDNFILQYEQHYSFVQSLWFSMNLLECRRSKLRDVAQLVTFVGYQLHCCSNAGGRINPYEIATVCSRLISPINFKSAHNSHVISSNWHTFLKHAAAKTGIDCISFLNVKRLAENYFKISACALLFGKRFYIILFDHYLHAARNNHK